MTDDSGNDNSDNFCITVITTTATIIHLLLIQPKSELLMLLFAHSLALLAHNARDIVWQVYYNTVIYNFLMLLNVS
jgi:hypothetical protein